MVQIAPGGGSLSYAGSIGGSGSDEGLGIAVDAEGAVYVTGGTTSSEATLPVRVGPDLTANATIADVAGTATIVDDDGGPPVFRRAPPCGGRHRHDRSGVHGVPQRHLGHVLGEGDDRGRQRPVLQ